MTSTPVPIVLCLESIDVAEIAVRKLRLDYEGALRFAYLASFIHTHESPEQYTTQLPLTIAMDS